MKRTTAEKTKTVLEKNTFYYYDRNYEESFEGQIHLLTETLLGLKFEISQHGLSEASFERLLAEKEEGLNALLALTGFSQESLKRLVTVVRIVNDAELSAVMNRSAWCPEEYAEEVREWSTEKIRELVRSNAGFRKGIVGLFFRGASVPFLSKTLPLFELKKLSVAKLRFEFDALVDTLIRYKQKGSYNASKGGNAEEVVRAILSRLKIGCETGDLSELTRHAHHTKRTLDFIIPSKERPVIVAESSFLTTTASGQGDKSKTEMNVRELLRKHYPHTVFLGFVDGIGWYARRSDLTRMVNAYDDVFTYHPDELQRFEEMLVVLRNAKKL